MTMIRKNERDLILSDTIMCAVLKIEADAIGVTLEEYVDRFLEVFYKGTQRLDFLSKKSNLSD